jgi:hypothetical protein
MGAHKSKENVSASNKNLMTMRPPSSYMSHPRQRIVQNFVLIWLDVSIDPKNEDCQNTLTQLRSVVHDINLFIEPDECIEFLKSIENEKAFIIISGSLGQQVVPRHSHHTAVRCDLHLLW